SGLLRVRGVQGHVAYPQLARNAVHESLPPLAELAATRWDAGDAQFSATTFQISNIRAGTGVNNVIPGLLEASFNFRYAPVSTVESLREGVAATLARHRVEHAIDWQVGALPYYSRPGPLRDATCAAIAAATGAPPELSTVGGTSDGRFFAALGAEVIELG